MIGFAEIAADHVQQQQQHRHHHKQQEDDEVQSKTDLCQVLQSAWQIVHMQHRVDVQQRERNPATQTRLRPDHVRDEGIFPSAEADAKETLPIDLRGGRGRQLLPCQKPRAAVGSKQNQYSW